MIVFGEPSNSSLASTSTVTDWLYFALAVSSNASFSDVTFTSTVVVTSPPFPSVIITLNDVSPFQSAFGVNVYSPVSESSVTVPFAGCSANVYVNVCPASTSVADTFPVTTWSSTVEIL